VKKITQAFLKLDPTNPADKEHRRFPPGKGVTAVLAGRLGAWPLWKSLASLVYPADIAGAEM
jgi:hypothetical protein